MNNKIDSEYRALVETAELLGIKNINFDSMYQAIDAISKRFSANSTNSDSCFSATARIANSNVELTVKTIDGTLQFDSYEDAEMLNHIDSFGALLWKNEEGKLLVSNGDCSEWDPFARNNNPIPVREGYSLHAVCMGKGLWAMTYYTGLKTYLPWAAKATDTLNTYLHGVMVHGSGWESTNHVLENHSTELEGTFWKGMQVLRNSGIPVYIASNRELIEIQNNVCSGVHHESTDMDFPSYTIEAADSIPVTNIGQLFILQAGKVYWTSTQYLNGADEECNKCAIYVSFWDNVNGYDWKTGQHANGRPSQYPTFALLHFGK